MSTTTSNPSASNPSMPPRPAAGPPHRTLTILLTIVVLGVLTQAVLAGSFISGLVDLRFAHMMVGWLLPFVALAPAMVALANWSTGRVSRPVAIGTAILPVLLWVQEALGHMPGAIPTAIHVPLGVVLFAGSLVLVVLSMRPVAASQPPEPRDVNEASLPRR